ncbi:protein LIKE COV 1-like [Bidens hawaiensis]|uniref:protein LIKE COV 1-like n=1 Tax=Bidens hawaiensis TaxID=980011 RepID=UPI00404B0D83
MEEKLLISSSREKDQWLLDLGDLFTECLFHRKQLIKLGVQSGRPRLTYESLRLDWTFVKVIRSWASKKFMTGCVILLPMAITFYITWWFIHFVDGFFSPVYDQLGINIFGLGFITSVTFIFLVGVFMSSWLGASVLSLGEWVIKRLPFMGHIYNASKQIRAAINPDQNTQAFKEVAIIRHPRIGEYAFGFITSSVTLQDFDGNVCNVEFLGDEDLYTVYVSTNHLYIGDIFLVNAKDVIRPNLSVREEIEIVVSGGMSMPQVLSTLDSKRPNEISRC